MSLHLTQDQAQRAPAPGRQMQAAAGDQANRVGGLQHHSRESARTQGFFSDPAAFAAISGPGDDQSIRQIALADLHQSRPVKCGLLPGWMAPQHCPLQPPQQPYGKPCCRPTPDLMQRAQAKPAPQRRIRFLPAQRHRAMTPGAIPRLNAPHQPPRPIKRRTPPVLLRFLQPHGVHLRLVYSYYVL
ncbi:MAG: hypothetical protein CMM78_03055 [Rhodospirillaceae bacterium]|nr:hypothetical protein [Rhodospirillales bacterium]MAX47164.1 hypothetical protein [Rhodospirillaceae bacterium]